MREPKTPLPWIGVGEFADPRDRAYAVHAANALPEVLAALRVVTDALSDYESGWRVNEAREAIAKAETK